MTSGVLSRTCRRATRTTSGDWPLLVFLHGSEEYGDGSEAQLPKVLKNGIPTMIAAGEWPAELPFVVLMPQYSFAEANGPCALNDEIESVIEWADRTYRIDPARIYLTGISCGAIGVLDYLAEFTGAKGRGHGADLKRPVCGVRR